MPIRFPHHLLFLASLLPALVASGADAAGKDEYCAVGDGAVALLVDRTTAYDEQDLNVLTAGLERIFEGLEPGDRLVVHTITDEYTSSDRAFDACVPGCPEGGGLLDWVMGSCKAVVAKADARDFRARLAAVLVEMLRNPRSYPASEIVRTVEATAKTYRNDNLKRMILFTDLLENSGVLSYDRLVGAAPDGNIARIADDGLLAPLTGVDVTVFGFGRSHDPERKALSRATELRVAEFWRAYFRKSGAAEVQIGLWYPS